MKETQSEDQGSKRNRREAQCHQGRGAVCPPLLGAQRLQQSLAQTRGWTNSGMKAMEGQARGSGV